MNRRVSNMKKTFKTYDEFLNESLVILEMKGLMVNEFMNNIELKQDFETARRILYERTSGIFQHKGENEFSLRSYKNYNNDEFDSVLKEVNEIMKRMTFSRTGNSKVTNIKENMWKLSCKLL
jgi:hypothetical protein